MITFIFLAILPKRAVYVITTEVPQSLEGKLKEIDRLKLENVLTEDEYQIKRRKIIEES